MNWRMNSMASQKKKSRSSKAGRKAFKGRARSPSAPRRGEPPRPTKWPDALLPHVIARTVCSEVSGFLNVHIPQRYEHWLTAKAEVCFQKNAHFRKGIRGRGNSGRDRLYMYMRHWMSSLLKTERLDLWYCLPESFDLGQRLPHGEHPRINRRNRLSLPPYRHWRPARVLAHQCWEFLAAA